MSHSKAVTAAAPRYVLTMAAASSQGQVAAITTMLERRGAYIEEFAAFDDALTERFFVRVVFRTNSGDANAPQMLRGHYSKLLLGFKDAQGEIFDTRRPTRVLIMVSKTDHCLRELLAQLRSGDLPMNVVAVVSNHADL